MQYITTTISFLALILSVIAVHFQYLNYKSKLIIVEKAKSYKIKDFNRFPLPEYKNNEYIIVNLVLINNSSSPLAIYGAYIFSNNINYPVQPVNILPELKFIDIESFLPIGITSENTKTIIKSYKIYEPLSLPIKFDPYDIKFVSLFFPSNENIENKIKLKIETTRKTIFYNLNLITIDKNYTSTQKELNPFSIDD